MNFLSLLFAKYLGIFDDISIFLNVSKMEKRISHFGTHLDHCVHIFFHSCLGVVHIEIELGSNTTQTMSSSAGYTNFLGLPVGIFCCDFKWGHWAK